MTHARARFARLAVLTAVSVGLFTTEGCNASKPPVEPPPPPKLGPIEVPQDIVAELLIRDPLVLAEALGRGLGRSDVADPKAWSKEIPAAAGEALEHVDLHGTMAALVLGDARKPEAWRIAVAARLKDVKAAKTKLAALEKAGKLEGRDLPSVRAHVYDLKKDGALAVIGEAVVFADKIETVESVGRFIGKEAAEGTPPHDVSLRVPLARYAAQLKGEASKLWGDGVAGDKALRFVDPIARRAIDALADVGDATFSVDVDKEDLVAELKIDATGALSTWLSKYPSGTASGILALPKANDVFAIRFPDAVGEWFKNANAAGKGTNEPVDAVDEALHALVATIGNEVAVVWNGPKKGANDKVSELMVRVEVVDGSAAKSAMKNLWSQMTKNPERKIQRSPYARLGAEGESLAIVDGGNKLDVKWAVKTQHLYFDVAFGKQKAALIDAAVDPSSKLLLGSDPRAKTFASKLPNDGLVFAYYAETSKAPKLEELGAVPALTGMRFGFVTASKEGWSGTFTVPLSELAPLGEKRTIEAVPVAPPPADAPKTP